MRGLDAAQLLAAATICQSRPRAEAAVYLTALAQPGLSLEDCAALPLGARDAGLGALRTAMFGRELSLRATCPACAAAVDVSLGVDDLGAGPPTRQSLTLGGARYAVRPATTADLAAIAGIEEAQARRAILARRCLVPEDGAAPARALTAQEVETVGAALARADPAGDPYVPLRCFGCGAAWEAPIDMARILAADIAGAGARLIDDIHDLASSYHWSEAEILALPPARRAAYLARLRA